MSKISALLLRAAFAVSLLTSGCTPKPDLIKTIPTTLEGVSYTVETRGGIGPATADFVQVVARLKARDNSFDVVVIDGEYLEFSKIYWTDSHNVYFCLKSGITNTFRNVVTLSVNSRVETIYNHLLENC